MLKEGDYVVCRLFNTPEHKFYGEKWTWQIISVRPLIVTKENHPNGIQLQRKEILRGLPGNM